MNIIDEVQNEFDVFLCENLLCTVLSSCVQHKPRKSEGHNGGSDYCHWLAGYWPL